MAMATIKRDKHKPVVHKSLRCENFAHPHKHRHITESRVLEAVREAVQYLETEENRRLVLADAEINGAERTEVEIATAQQRMEEMHSALHKANDAYVLGRMDETRYQRQVERLTAQIRNIEQSVRDLQDRLELHQNESQRAVRIEEVVKIGIAMLESEDIKTANAWLRRHFRIWVKNRQVVRIDYL